jgi:hypothetical protein
MERIESLIRKLKEQFDQKADSTLMLGTVQLLEFELTKFNSNNHSSLGTAKIAVVLPSPTRAAAPVQTIHEKYAPQPQQPEQREEPAVKEVKETLLVDEGTVSVVQKNGQLDMVFDPMTEIPTLSQQSHGKEVNDLAEKGESLNDKLKGGKTELIEILKETPVKDLRKAIGINDRFLFINELFRGDESMYERCIKTINGFNIYAEAEYWMTRELKVKLGWDSDSNTVKHFYMLVKRRFL